MLRIYVASSWRNLYQPGVVNRLRALGHEVYDFRAPYGHPKGFSWSEIDPEWKTWDAVKYRQALSHPRAEEGFQNDMQALRHCDVCVLVQPCGTSAHLELGWAVGAGKRTCVYFPDVPMEREAELMVKMCDVILIGPLALNRWLEEMKL
jgi:hypothetical protein